MSTLIHPLVVFLNSWYRILTLKNLSNLNSILVVSACLMSATFAICSAAEPTSGASVGQVDEVQVLNQENVVGPASIDLIAMCRHEFAKNSSRCKDSLRAF